MWGLLLSSVVCAPGAFPLAEGWASHSGDLPIEGEVVRFEDAAFTPFAVPGWAPHDAREPFTWLRVRLPEALPPTAALHLDVVVGHFEVFLGARRIASFPPGLGVRATGMNGTPWHLIDLPADAGGQWLLLRTKTNWPVAGFQGVPRVGAREALLREMVQRDVPRFVMGALMVLLGLLALLLLRAEHSRLARALVPWAIAGGTYTLFYTQLKQLVLPLPAPLWFFLWPVSVAVLAVTWLRFLEAAMETPSRWLLRFRRLSDVLGAAYVATSALAWALLEFLPDAERLAVLGFYAVGSALRVTMLVSSTWSVVWLVQLGRGRGSHADRPRARTLLWGVAVLLFATWVNALAALGLGPQSAGAFVPAGLLALTVALVALVERAWLETRDRVSASERALAARALEKEAMLRDLHDGIGNVTTNIRLLAELGKRDAQRGEQALATIAELSAEGLAELRAFIQTLDERDVTWPVMVSELRRFGGQLVESHGKQFTLEASIHERAPAPGGALSLALLRIFREALTNVAKHSSAGRVEVRLTADESTLSLALEDDGPGGGSGGGLDTGRGLKNMRARAQELGGLLEVSSAPNRLRLSLPLGGRS